MMPERPSQIVTAFRNLPLPEPGRLAGYAALIERFDLAVPIVGPFVAIAERHHPESTATWRMLTPRHAPPPTLAGELTFALRYEGIDLTVLSRLLRKIDAAEIVKIVEASPTGAYARRTW